MKIKPSAISFVLRYFIFTYFFVFSLFSIWLINEVAFGWYIAIWIFMTLLPALILSFKRVKFGWFFWIGLLDLLSFAPQFKFVYDKLLSLSSDHFYQEVLKWLQNSSEIKIYIIVSILGIIFTQLYRLSFSYEINENGIILKSGLFSRNDRTILLRQLTDLEMHRGLFQRIFGIGTIVPITAAGMGMGSDTVFGGGMAEKGGLGGFVGAGKSRNIPITSDPSMVIYGVKNPKKVKDEILKIINQH